MHGPDSWFAMRLEPVNREFVTICYKTYLNREPDQAGLNAWVKLMNQGSSADEILNGFINSQEFGKLCASYGIEK